MKITAKVLADSVNGMLGTRLTTLELRYPRYIHAEFMTHRVFSRNASSSRAIPINKQIDAVEAQPVMPLEWGSNKPGMQAGEPISRIAQTEAEGIWVQALNDAVGAARKLKDLGVHKQIVNRLLEPFAHITVIMTATEFNNFFDLRISPLAQPEIQELAKKMKKAMDESTPIISYGGYVHAPYVTANERAVYNDDNLCMISAARCARVSYLNHDGLEPDVAKDYMLAQRLREDRHASVFEHQAFPMETAEWSNNFRHWLQFRATLGL